ncbi:response regulator transcription factor [Aestuariispira insulae]|uniref:Response regulator receiver domain-containing protein n=1 Tax=Aestuariispira insulae TaxID=1461337 RepID=A0A3D9HWE1_9PROT|nr:response regulator transcription factor [Aestuariispira insulae]RED53818.1 response regulator receiver domain-containing protein [Aestuariispira insulae]
MENDKVRIVLADDELVIRKLVSALIEQTEFELVGVAADGAEALTMCKQLKPDVLLLDIHMPGFSGIRTLKNLFESGDMPIVILLTAEDQTDIVDDCFRYGAKYRVNKNSRMDTLPDVIRTATAT